MRTIHKRQSPKPEQSSHTQIFFSLSISSFLSFRFDSTQSIFPAVWQYAAFKDICKIFPRVKFMPAAFFRKRCKISLLLLLLITNRNIELKGFTTMRKLILRPLFNLFIGKSSVLGD
jgi:hypothetical protein